MLVAIYRQDCRDAQVARLLRNHWLNIIIHFKGDFGFFWHRNDNTAQSTTSGMISRKRSSKFPSQVRSLFLFFFRILLAPISHIPGWHKRLSHLAVDSPCSWPVDCQCMFSDFSGKYPGANIITCNPFFSGFQSWIVFKKTMNLRILKLNIGFVPVIRENLLRGRCLSVIPLLSKR